MSYGTCKKCGCTDKNACYSDQHGPCWWADETHELCSFCEESFASFDSIELPSDFENETSIQP